MENAQIETLLSIHADALNRGEDHTSQLLAHTNGYRAELELLFRLAQALHKALRPLTAPADIASLIVDDVREEAGTVHWVEKIEKKRLFWVIGGVAGIAGVLFWMRSRNTGNISTAV